MPAERPSLERSLQDAGRRLSAATIAFHRKVAARLGLNDTDHKCLDLLLREGPMTAGQLAAKSGYTTGAVTGIANRLTLKALVARVPDSADARRVVLQADAARTHQLMWPLLQPMITAMGQLHAQRDVNELRLIRDYLHASAEVLEQTAPDET